MKLLPTHTDSIHRQRGYTLIELLLYVAIVGALLTTVTYFFGTVAAARVKNQSIQEVNDQGTAVMDYLTQTVHNASAITAPAAGTSASSLTLTVPTGSLSPTVFSSNSSTLGYSTDGGTSDTGDSGFMNATKFTASSSGTISTLYALIGSSISASPNNKGQMAIYSGTTSPTTLLASSTATTLVASSWNAFSISAVSITSGQTYWLAYNTNGLASVDNDLRYHTGTTGQSMYLAQSYGTWPTSWAAGAAQNVEFSMYAAVDTGASGTIQVKEGAAAVVPLVNSKVQVNGLTFKNLSRAGTPGSVQISFVLSRVNPNGTNEFDYQKTFTGTAEIAW